MRFDPPARPPPARRRKRSRPVYSTSVRLSADVVDKIDFVIAHEPRVQSRSDAINLALDHWLVMAMDAITRKRSG